MIDQSENSIWPLQIDLIDVIPTGHKGHNYSVILTLKDIRFL